MQSQARTVEKDAYLARLAAAQDQNFVFVIDRRRQLQLWYCTDMDVKIAAVEEAAQMFFGLARRNFASARRWQARGEHDRAADQFRYARTYHEHARQYLRDRARLIAERDQEGEAA